LPNIIAITSAHAERTVFTRFIPAQKPGQGVGMWRHYYERWASMTIDRIGPDMGELVPALAAFVPPARVFDKLSTRLGPAASCTSGCAVPASIL
jgi:hypothetical protein